MAHMYGVLPNYVHMNALQELRDENKELKVKLEEHSTAMEKLQKGYETLEMEFKTLQYNYSSLLMTARSEVQRKTQMITQLNAEKELLMLNALKSGKPIRRNANQCVKHPGWINYDRASRKGNNKNKEANVKQNDSIKCERFENKSVDQLG